VKWAKGYKLIKTLQKTIFLLLASLVCADVNAVKGRLHGYKIPDLHQQRQQTQQTVKHLQEISTPRTARFEHRHPIRLKTDTSSTRPILGLLFAAMICSASVTPPPYLMSIASKDLKLPTEKTEAIATETSSMVHKISNPCGAWANVFGLCNGLPRDECTSCCGIGSNFTTNCYSFPPSRHISFGLEDINNFNITKAYLEAKKICAQIPKTSHIAGETLKLLNQLSPKYLQNLNGTHCTIATSNPDGELHEIGYPVPILDIVCPIKISDISLTNVIPTLVGTIEKLARKFNLREIPKTFVSGHKACNEFSLPKAAMTVFKNDDGSLTQGILLPYNTLIKSSDQEIADVLGHEVHHLKQFEISGKNHKLMHIRTGNNIELEADIASILVRGMPCFALWMEKFLWEEVTDPVERLQPLTIAQILEINKNPFTHPPVPVRMAAMLQQYEQYKNARAIIQETQED